jgi:hypothetical protein
MFKKQENKSLLNYLKDKVGDITYIKYTTSNPFLRDEKTTKIYKCDNCLCFFKEKYMDESITSGDKRYVSCKACMEQISTYAKKHKPKTRTRDNHSAGQICITYCGK